MSVEEALEFFRNEVEEKIRLNDADTRESELTLSTARDRFEAATKIRVYDREDLLALVVYEDKENHIKLAQGNIERAQKKLDRLALEHSNLETLLAHIDQAQNDLREE